jgi:hypothetical protein
MVGRFYFLAFFLVLFSCKSGEGEVTDGDISDVDSLSVELGMDDSGETEEKAKEADLNESTKAIEEIYGEQWDFCACIVVQDSIDKAFQKDLSDAEMDRLIERSDFVDNKCKTLLIQPNSTPEEREKHEKKVRNCLRSAKKK